MREIASMNDSQESSLLSESRKEGFGSDALLKRSKRKASFAKTPNFIKSPRSLASSNHFNTREASSQGDLIILK